GYNQYNVTATDLASNNQTSNNRSFTIDMTPPELASASAIAVRQIEVVFDEDLIGEDLTVGDFQVISNETEIGIESVSEENGEVILNLLSDLTSQTPTIIINPSISQSIKDVAGNEQTQTNSKVASDKIAPTIEAGSSPSKNRVEFTQNATVSDGVGGAGIAGYEWSVVSTPDNETAIVVFGTPNTEDTTVSANIDGEYKIRLTTMDNAGNIVSDDVIFEWGSPSRRRVIVDNTGMDNSGNSDTTTSDSTSNSNSGTTGGSSNTNDGSGTSDETPIIEETPVQEPVVTPPAPSIDDGKVLGVKVVLLDELIAKLKFGDRGDEVNDLQNELQRLGFFPANFKTTKYYGSITASAVAKYLASKGCAKVKAIDDLIAITKFGTRNENVKLLQTELSKINYFLARQITGYFGPITKASVVKYQAECK
ncbi:MAG: peptidoglycan-binding protein, partial [Patescibacteria group bacterium]